tara:strand:+ start:30 stop:518 length:489 start_codon:yes stop_codon:yes gene_type:complete
MATIFCEDCHEDHPCSHRHLYVIQLKDEIGEIYENKSNKGYLYVGETGKSVEERGRMNFKRKDGEDVDPDELYHDRKKPEHEQKWPEDGEWEYDKKSSPKIRAYYWKYRPDLVLYENPIPYDKKEPNKIYRLEGKLADKLRNRGWRTINKVSWKNREKVDSD